MLRKVVRKKFIIDVDGENLSFIWCASCSGNRKITMSGWFTTLVQIKVYLHGLQWNFVQMLIIPAG